MECSGGWRGKGCSGRVAMDGDRLGMRLDGEVVGEGCSSW